MTGRMMLYCYWVAVSPQSSTHYPPYCHHDAGGGGWLDKHQQPTPSPATPNLPTKGGGCGESVHQYHNGKVTKGNYITATIFPFTPTISPGSTGKW